MAVAATSLQFHNVFVYGTLMADEVVNVLLNRVPPSSPAVLQGYRRHSIRGRVYPAIVPAENNSVNGKVIRDLTDYEMDLFDEFEDVEYVRTLEEVIVLGNETQQNGSDQLKAHTYVWADANDENLYGEWNFKFIIVPHKVVLILDEIHNICSGVSKFTYTLNGDELARDSPTEGGNGKMFT